MNKLLVILVLVFAGLEMGCANNPEKKGDQTNSTMVNSSTDNNDGKPIHLNTADFKAKVFNYDVNKEWKYEGNLPCIVDFYADWCGPCKRVAPILEELAGEYKGKILVYKVNTDNEPELSNAFGIRSIPSLLFIPVNGQPQMAQGALPKEQLEKAINDVLLKTN